MDDGKGDNYFPDVEQLLVSDLSIHGDRAIELDTIVSQSERDENPREDEERKNNANDEGERGERKREKREGEGDSEQFTDDNDSYDVRNPFAFVDEEECERTREKKSFFRYVATVSDNERN